MAKLLQDSLQCTVLGVDQEGSLQSVGFPPFLQKNRVYIWSALYGDLDLHYKILSGITSREERHAASLFRNAADTRKYVLRQGVLRILLGNYTDQNPERVSFLTGKNGKPELDIRGRYDDVSFNLSHTGEMILIGITRNQQIGVDIVKIDPLYHYHDSAEYILTPAEKACMQRVEPAMRYQIFFRIWALKEAILKVTGDTLSMMQETDTSDIINKGFTFTCCSIKYRNSLPPLFIWQFNREPDHYGAIAAEIGSPSHLNGE